MPYTRASTRGASTARHDLVELLKRDHERLLRAFREFDHLESLQACQQIVQRTCAELKVHAALEEELFYPAVRDTVDEPDLVAEAEIEHRSIATLVEYIELLAPDDIKYRASFRVLGDYVVHHVREEENEMFPQLAHAAIDWDALAAAMAARRVELCEEFGLACDEPAPRADRRQAAEAGETR
jgi:hemerythrin superfamily protein